MLRGFAAGVAAMISFAFPSELLAGGEWPDGPNKRWFQALQRPDNDKNPYRDEKSRSCCGVADTVKTKFKVEAGDEKYPEDRWYAWIKDEWIPIARDKIVSDYALDGQPYDGGSRPVLRSPEGRALSSRVRASSCLSSSTKALRWLARVLAFAMADDSLRLLSPRTDISSF